MISFVLFPQVSQPSMSFNKREWVRSFSLGFNVHVSELFYWICSDKRLSNWILFELNHTCLSNLVTLITAISSFVMVSLVPIDRPFRLTDKKANLLKHAYDADWWKPNYTAQSKHLEAEKNKTREILIFLTKLTILPGGYSTNFYTGRLRPEVEPLTLFDIPFSRKMYPFRIPSIAKWYPFHIPRLELCNPFNCRKYIVI